MSAVTRPLVRWHGGKFRLAPWILSLIPPHRTYVEPFGGGGSVLLRKARSYAEVYNDLDGEIVNLFQVARDHGEELRRRIALTPFARTEFEASRNLPTDPIEQARLLVVRSHMGVGGNAATTKGSRSGRVSTGFRSKAVLRSTHPAMDWARLPESLDAVIERLQGVVIEKRDAFEIIEKMDGRETVFYVDPPYLTSTRDDARPDYRHELTEADHIRLAALLKSLRGGVLLSGYASSLYEELYQGWHRVETPALADGGRPRTEVLWMNYQPSQGRLDL